VDRLAQDGPSGFLENAIDATSLPSVATGKVRIHWEIETCATRQCLRFSWKEMGGPRIEQPQPQRDGFGKLMITKLVPKSLRGKASLEFDPEGVRWVLMAPSASVLA
jgi:two-component sensor histidine kinase